MPLLTGTEKQCVNKNSFTDEEYKIFFALLDKLCEVKTSSKEDAQSRATLIAQIDNHLYLAAEKQAIPGKQTSPYNTKEAKLASQVIVESVMEALGARI